MKCTLNQSQTSVLWHAATALPAQVRGLFFADVNARLAGIGRPMTDTEVQNAIVATLGDRPSIALCNEGS